MIRRLLRFRLLALLIAMALLCVTLAIYVPQRRWVATAQINVKERPGNVTYTANKPALLDKGDPYTQELNAWEAADDGSLPPPPKVVPFDRKEFREGFNRFVKSTALARSALSDPRLSTNRFLLQRADPLEWLQENLSAEFLPGQGTFEIRLEHRLRSGDDLKAIVDVVADLAVVEAIRRDASDQEHSLSLLHVHLDKTSDEFARVRRHSSILTPTAKKNFMKENAEYMQKLGQLAGDTRKRITKFNAKQSKPIDIKRVGPTELRWRL